MFIRAVMIVFVLMTLFLVPSFAAEPNLKDGMWEITTNMEMPGIPAGSMPAQKINQCITKKDSVPQKPEKESECKMISTKVVGDTVFWNMQCRMKDGSKIDSEGTATYKGDKFDGVTNMTMSQPGEKAMKMTQRMSGRRIGECK
jgi:hypothetical protein